MATVTMTDVVDGVAVDSSSVSVEVSQGTTGPQGPKGDPGDPGDAGADGESAYQLAVDAGFSGTVSEWLASLVGAQGDPGSDGSDGADGSDGRGIVSVARTSGDGSAGTTDTYTITYTDATTSTFDVYNGADGDAGTGTPSWDDITDKPATFPPTIGTTSTTALAGDTAIPNSPDDIGAATSAQGALADTAVQPGDLATVATSGAYTDLSGTPTLGTAAAADTGDFDAAGAAAAAQTAAEGYADTGLAEKISGLTSDDDSVTITDNGDGTLDLSAPGGGGGGGGGGTPTTPTVRAASIHYKTSGTTNTVALPTGTQAGDLLVMFTADGRGVSLPPNWEQLDNQSGTSIAGAVGIALATGGVVSAGSVSYTTTVSDVGYIALVAITAGTFRKDLPSPVSMGSYFLRESGTLTSPRSFGTARSSQDNQLALYFGFTRTATGATTIASSVGSSVLSGADGSFAYVVASHAIADADTEETPSFTLGQTATADYGGAVVLLGAL